MIAGCRDDQRAPDRSPNENKGSLFFFYPFARAKRGTRAKANRHELHISHSKRRKLQCFPIVPFVYRSLFLSHPAYKWDDGNNRMMTYQFSFSRRWKFQAFLALFWARRPAGSRPKLPRFFDDVIYVAGLKRHFCAA